MFLQREMILQSARRWLSPSLSNKKKNMPSDAGVICSIRSWGSLLCQHSLCLFLVVLVPWCEHHSSLHQLFHLTHTNRHKHTRICEFPNQAFFDNRQCLNYRWILWFSQCSSSAKNVKLWRSTYDCIMTIL